MRKLHSFSRFELFTQNFYGEKKSEAIVAYFKNFEILKKAKIIMLGHNYVWSLTANDQKDKIGNMS